MSIIGGAEPGTSSEQSLATTEDDDGWNVVGMPKIKQVSIVIPSV